MYRFRRTGSGTDQAYKSQGWSYEPMKTLWVYLDIYCEPDLLPFVRDQTRERELSDCNHKRTIGKQLYTIELSWWYFKDMD